MKGRVPRGAWRPQREEVQLLSGVGECSERGCSSYGKTG